MLFIICDYFCKWGFCWGRALSTPLQVQGPGDLLYTNIHTEIICMKACCTYRSCMKITLSHKEQQIFLAQCFWKGITDFEVLN